MGGNFTLYLLLEYWVLLEILINNLEPGNYILTVTDANGCQTIVPNLVIESCNFDLPTIDIRPWHITPLGGPDGSTITPHITNLANPPYTYNWAGPDGFESTQLSVSNLNSAGEYCITVTDACGRSNSACVELFDLCDDRYFEFAPVNLCIGNEEERVTSIFLKCGVLIFHKISQNTYT